MGSSGGTGEALRHGLLQRSQHAGQRKVGSNTIPAWQVQGQSLEGQLGVPGPEQPLLAPAEWSMLEGPCTKHWEHTKPGRSSCCPKLTFLVPQ